MARDGAKYAAPGSGVDRIGSSGNRAIFRRTPKNVSVPPNRGSAPFNRISLDLSEFGENGVYLARVCGGPEIRDPPDPWQNA